MRVGDFFVMKALQGTYAQCIYTQRGYVVEMVGVCLGINNKE